MRYGLTASQARFANVVGAALLATAVLALASNLVLLWHAAPGFRCDASGCVGAVKALAAAPDDARAALAASPVALAGFTRYLGSWPVRLGLFAILVLQSLPFALLTGSVGFALRRLGGRAPESLRQALPWLRRAALAALALAIVTPVAQSLRAMLLFPGTPAGPMWWFEVDFVQTGQHLLLALTANVIVWAIAAGSEAERDASGFV